MIVEELIEKLKKLPQEKIVKTNDDGVWYQVEGAEYDKINDEVRLH